MPRIGYARVSTSSQDLDIQKTTLKAAGCEIVRAEIGSGITVAIKGKFGTAMTESEILEIAQGETKILICFVSIYRDVFGITHRTIGRMINIRPEAGDGGIIAFTNAKRNNRSN